MAKIPFSIDFRPQIESGEYKLETECGRPVSIMDWEWVDRNEKKCLAVKVLMDEGFNIGYLFDYDGKRHSIFPSDSDSDLFIITPELELSEFEKKLSDVVGYAISLSVAEPQKPTSEFVKEYAAELLALARKELVEEQYTSDPRKTDLYKLGKAEALKDLPRWEKCDWPIPKIGAHVDNSGRLIFCGKYVNVEDLEKLPGFKEDSHE